MILSCSNVTKSFGVTEILKDISFMINKNDKVAIVGVNGAGKTTMFKIITRELKQDSGDISFSKDVQSVGYLTQNLDLDESLNIYDTFIKVFQNIIDLEEEIRQTEIQMAKVSADEHEKLFKKYNDLNDKFERLSGYEYKSRVRGVIKGLGFTEEEGLKKISVLSGGEKSRVALGRLLLKNPEILLLDEPTNHLDIKSVEWLEEYLRDYKGTVLLISHDRYFIDRVVNKIIEIENGKSMTYNGDFKNYIMRKKINRELDLKHYEEQQKEIKRQEEVIKKLRQFNREKSIKRAESRERLLEKVERIDRPENEPKKIRIKIKPKVKSGFEVLKVEELSKSFENRELFKGVTFQINRGEKVALIGANGIGKTTILKIILKEEEQNFGQVKFGVNVETGYYDQEHEYLNDEKEILEDIHDAYPFLTTLEIRNVLASFVYIGEDVNKKIKTLSGGEKGRVSLAKIMLSKANFLILDEPTNHLDMFSREILEDALKDYDGTVFYVSHDRYFVNNTADKILELSPNGMKEYLGDYDYYLQKKKENEFNAPENPKEEKAKPKINFNRNEERKIKTQIRLVEDKISAIETEIENMEIELAKDEIASDYIKTQEIFELKTKKENELVALYEEWEELGLKIQNTET